MPNVALIPGARTQIPALMAVVDGYPDTAHSLTTDTGGEPLESGRQVMDHAVARPEKLVLTGWVSDFSGGNRPRAAWEQIRRLVKEETITPVRVITEWGDYPEMIIARADAAQLGRGLRFIMELKEVIRTPDQQAELPMDALMSAMPEMLLGESADANSLLENASGVVTMEATGAMDGASPGDGSLLDTISGLSDQITSASRTVRNLIRRGPVSVLTGALPENTANLVRDATSLAQQTGLIGDLNLAGRLGSSARTTLRKAENITGLVGRASRSAVAVNRSGEIARGRLSLGGLFG